MAEDDILFLHEWANRVRVESELLAQALAGEVVLDVKGGQVTFRRPSPTDRQQFQVGLRQLRTKQGRKP